MWRQEGLGIPGNTVATGCALELAPEGTGTINVTLALYLAGMAAMTVA